MKVHIFNPENDLALADGKPGYTAPASARQMRHDLYWLPKWWADEGDVVWNGQESLSLQPGDEIRPWGWSPALIHELRQAGVADDFLPTDEEMDRLRQLSHRQTAVEALHQLAEDGVAEGFRCGESRLCTSVEEAMAAPRSLLKAPWSSSGKGLMMSDAAGAEGWCRRTLRQQGSIVAEQPLTKLADFALLFQLDGRGGVEYRGLSLFHTNAQGAYTGNWLAPEGEKLQWLMQYVPPQPLMEIRRWWEQYLAHFDYRGPLGVDMMLAQEGICPCIEINWRMTMGHVAQLLTEQGRTGKLLVHYIYGQYCAEVEAFC
ncbi:MAG: hypothetical protein IJR87_04450 [Bacteroidaceae bacterium]|nr:hypothetical protein [Bacteroidaceae bacterium]